MLSSGSKVMIPFFVETNYPFVSKNVFWRSWRKKDKEKCPESRWVEFTNSIVCYLHIRDVFSCQPFLVWLPHRLTVEEWWAYRLRNECGEVCCYLYILLSLFSESPTCIFPQQLWDILCVLDMTIEEPDSQGILQLGCSCPRLHVL